MQCVMRKIFLKGDDGGKHASHFFCIKGVGVVNDFAVKWFPICLLKFCFNLDHLLRRRRCCCASFTLNTWSIFCRWRRAASSGSSQKTIFSNETGMLEHCHTFVIPFLCHVITVIIVITIVFFVQRPVRPSLFAFWCACTTHGKPFAIIIVFIILSLIQLSSGVNAGSVLNGKDLLYKGSPWQGVSRSIMSLNLIYRCFDYVSPFDIFRFLMILILQGCT